MAFIAIALGLAGGTSAAAQPAASAGRSAAALFDAAFQPTGFAAQVDPGARFAERDAYARGRGPVLWRSGEVRLSGLADDGPVDSVRVNVAGILRMPAGRPIASDRDQFDAQTIDVTLIRSWPRAVSFSADGLEFDVSPHAGLGVSSFGGQAEGGAMLTVSKTREQQAIERLRDMGVKDGQAFGDTGRWYLFAAASGRAVGFNMLKGERGWDRAGWSTDPTGALVGDAQVGVGWRKGDIQSSFGVIYREVRGNHMVFGQMTRDDTVAAVSFSIRPQR